MISDRDILGAVKEWIIGKFGNVNNTSDADKPISTAQQEEFDKKVNKDDIMQGATTTTAGKAGLVPAPGTGNPDAVLKSNGTWGEGIYRALGEASASGWYRIFSKTTNAVAGSGDSFMLTVSRGYSNNPPENFRIVCSTRYNSDNWNWHTLTCMVSGTKFVDKVRAAKKDKKLYIEIHYAANTRDTISFELLYNSGFGTFSQEPRQGLNLELAEEDEIVVSEHTIPVKDDFDTSKSLTRGIKILDNSNLKSDTYCIPGNYYSGDSNAIKNYTNRPMQLTSAFRLYVSYGVNDDYYIQQRFEDLLGRVIVVRTKYGRGSSATWSDEYAYYPSVGTPPANKLWGTDSSGNVGWIDPP